MTTIEERVPPPGTIYVQPRPQPERHEVIGYSDWRDRALCLCGDIAMHDADREAWVSAGHVWQLHPEPRKVETDVSDQGPVGLDASGLRPAHRSARHDLAAKEAAEYIGAALSGLPTWSDARVVPAISETLRSTPPPDLGDWVARRDKDNRNRRDRERRLRNRQDLERRIPGYTAPGFRPGSRGPSVGPAGRPARG